MEEVQMASKEMYERLISAQKREIITDHVSGDFMYLKEFANLWEKNLDLKNLMTSDGLSSIPGDIFRAGTVPIESMGLTMTNFPVPDGFREHASKRMPPKAVDEFVRRCADPKESNIVIYPEYKHLIAMHDVVPNSEDRTIPIGHIHIVERGDIYPLVFRGDSVYISPFVSDVDLDYTTFIHLFTQYNNLGFGNPYNAGIRFVYAHLYIWYGIQISLLHPITKDIFEHSTRGKIPHKMLMRQNTKTGRVKYIRRHKITLDNSVEKVLHTASTKNDMKYQRHKMLWRVIGHDRRLPDGRTTFIKPHWRGPLKDVGDFTSIKINERDVPISDDIKNKKK